MTHDQIEAMTLQTAALKAGMDDLSRMAEGFGQAITRAFASAIIQGQKLSDVLKGLALSLANQALSAALRPLGSLIGSFVAPLAGAPAAREATGMRTAGAPVTVTVNISTPNAESFRQSQGQVAAMLARAVARGQRNL
jgi:dihydroorotate dehydrogenase